VTDLLKELHRIVNRAIETAELRDEQADVKFYDLSQIDLERLRDEFAKKVRRKATALQDIRQLVEDKLAQMVAQNPLRVDYIYESLPTPPFDDDEKQEIARLAYQHIWQQSTGGGYFTATTV
jgi:hypothetical protein